MKQEPPRSEQTPRRRSTDTHEPPRPVDHLARARESCEHQAWRDAHEAYLAADALAPLAGDDLDGLALAACLIGQERDFLATRSVRIARTWPRTARSARPEMPSGWR